MKQIDIKDLSSDDLNEKLLEQKELLVKLKMNHVVSPLENPKQLGVIKKKIHIYKILLQIIINKY